jgi:acyl homoserine lactone synthase
MLFAINVENAHNYGDALPQIFRLRYRQFKERQNYAVPAIRQMEYDQYDTPATVYLADLDEKGSVRATSRLNATDRPHMLSDLWPDMVEYQPLPQSSDIWEGTRICIDKALPAATREQIKWEIVIAYLEFGLHNGIKKYVGIMQNLIWHKVFIQSGWGAEYLGAEKLVDGVRTRAGQVHVSEQALARVRQKTGIAYRVLQNLEDDPAYAIAG